MQKISYPATRAYVDGNRNLRAFSPRVTKTQALYSVKDNALKKDDLREALLGLTSQYSQRHVFAKSWRIQRVGGGAIERCALGYHTRFRIDPFSSPFPLR